ncbi:MAG TPA: His-Xaa-Ser system protein HxsD [Thermoanaerobaculia bacterium]|nr:His-Xaa-Ser system protein HxsD [Thermoanaerobaculia bacterium]
MTGIRDSQATPVAISLGQTQAALELDLSIYAERAISRAAYKFTDRCYLFLARSEQPGWMKVTFGAKEEKQSLLPLLGEFCNELLDQQIREDLGNEAGPIRDLIVAQAFAEGNLLDPQRDEGSYQDDPLGIGALR